MIDVEKATKKRSELFRLKMISRPSAPPTALTRRQVMIRVENTASVNVSCWIRFR